jgi:hypothetical protein
MPQPEATFKAKLISLHRKAAGADTWYTYLAAGGPGQKPGLPDLVFGSPGRGILWCEAKMGDGLPQLRPLQRRCIANLVRCGANVIIPSRHTRDSMSAVSLWRMTSTGSVYCAATALLGPDLWPTIWRLCP